MPSFIFFVGICYYCFHIGFLLCAIVFFWFSAFGYCIAFACFFVPFHFALPLSFACMVFAYSFRFLSMIMASEYTAEVKCIICNDGSQRTGGSLSALTTKGASTVMKAADIRGRQDIIECLSSCDLTSHHVHADCRKSFTDTRKLKRVKVDENLSSTSLTLRSCTGT